MSIRVALNHKTEYKFDRFVSLSPHIVRLWPAPHCRTPILSRSLKITPSKHFLNWQQDPYSNWQARLVFPEKTNVLSIEIDIVAEILNINPFDFFIDDSAKTYPFSYESTLAKELVPYLETIPAGPKFHAFLETIPRRPVVTVDFLVAINQRLCNELKYLIRMEPGVQTPEETLTLKSGSCRDFAWLLVQSLRHLGLAARFVSGYSIQLVADEKPLDGPAGVTADCCDLHAWAEVYVPGAGWIGLDATCGLITGSGYIPLAATAEPSTAAPVSGSVMFDTIPGKKDDKLGEEFVFEMSVRRLHEDPRVTRPYTEEQWKEILETGNAIDAQFAEDGVKMTMGGEPTFVSVDSRDDPEWNTLALGPRKRAAAGELLKRLRKRFTTGALLHYGQGKQYPGESLPRWALGCYWRKDGEPIWQNPELIGNESVSPGYGETQAQKFMTTLAEHLSVPTAHIIPGFEDAFYYMLQERKLPINVDPLTNRLEDPEVRARMTKVFDQGLKKVIGFALPLQRRLVDNEIRWVTGPWFLRREHLFLIPGDSPMGYRLPLESLTWSPLADRAFYNLDPMDDLPALPAYNALQQFIVSPGSLRSAIRDDMRLRGRPTQAEGRLPEAEEKLRASSDSPVAYDQIRTALCVEPRDGQLFVFLPPQKYLEDYLNLVAAVEKTAADLQLPVFVEGYAPPHDPRVNVIKVTPDPGVIEVNIHPSANWKELVERTEILYEEARQTRLATEKFMLDGRHTGTGGGNHVVIGGATPQESPLLKRPDVLRSMLAYWHNHPSLSFLFSGLFIGPTSQHPRIDEARNDSLYELDIAFKQLPDHAQTQPWVVDRVLRNLLIDVSGNTHRTEFCIDKLFSPDSSTGRLGLVELRSFEMPPHARMSAAQQLLLRALIARFWRAPYKHHLVRWGTEIHDRFMLPHFTQADFVDVLEDLQEHGYPLQSHWFDPHMEFRFPVYGTVAQRGVLMELRQALEPWHVMGEEPGGGGAVRYVDSSIERLQVKVNGMVGSRHVVLCNGQHVPLHPTGTNGEFVAGIRYRAWQPPSCLHPLIGVHAPLHIEIADTWNSRSIGGCMYHVAHPGGRSYDTFPINAYEAEGRRLNRFFPHGHTHGTLTIPPFERSNEFPFTLDLRAM